MPRYRGNWEDARREPHPDCATENDSIQPYNYAQCCGTTDPVTLSGWYCTRPRGHAGDHVTISGSRLIIRWSPHRSLSDRSR